MNDITNNNAGNTEIFTTQCASWTIDLDQHCAYTSAGFLLDYANFLPAIEDEEGFMEFSNAGCYSYEVIVGVEQTTLVIEPFHDEDDEMRPLDAESLAGLISAIGSEDEAAIARSVIELYESVEREHDKKTIAYKEAAAKRDAGIAESDEPFFVVSHWALLCVYAADNDRVLVVLKDDSFYSVVVSEEEWELFYRANRGDLMNITDPRRTNQLWFSRAISHFFGCVGWWRGILND